MNLQKKYMHTITIGDYVIIKQHIKVEKRYFGTTFVTYDVPTESIVVKGNVESVKGDDLRIAGEWYHKGLGVGEITLVSIIK